MTSVGEIAIKVEALSKKYEIGHQKAVSINERIKYGLGQIFGGQNVEREDFWALKDINFEIKKGEAVGIIGKNGAGKSTLLKILSKITYPTHGRFEMEGRVSSLLEVGTGFHPELSGRENIFLNGTILGMSRKEVRSKFDEIVAFSGVEKFIDTPVKHYSSGMYVRLAFAVAAHLEPEILIIDEVLAVGDAEFQKKCLGKMDEVAKQGRTVLFVSHNMQLIENLCPRGLLLSRGEIKREGTAVEAIDQYCTDLSESASYDINLRVDRSGAGNLKVTKFWSQNSEGQLTNTFKIGESLIFGVEVNNNTAEALNMDIAIAINSQKGVAIVDLSSYVCGRTFEITEYKVVKCRILSPLLNSGRYLCSVMVRNGRLIEDWVLDVFEFEVVSHDYYSSGHLPDQGRLVLMDQVWTA